MLIIVINVLEKKPNIDSGTLSGIHVGESFEMIDLDIVGPLPTSKNVISIFWYLVTI